MIAGVGTDVKRQLIELMGTGEAAGETPNRDGRRREKREQRTTNCLEHELGSLADLAEAGVAAAALAGEEALGVGDPAICTENLLHPKD